MLPPYHTTTVSLLVVIPGMVWYGIPKSDGREQKGNQEKGEKE
jgi:hypothetical protein